MNYTKCRKEDGHYKIFNLEKIATSITKAAAQINKNNLNIDRILDEVLKILPGEMQHKIPTTNEIGLAVEKALMHLKHEDIAREFILYRDKRRANREANSSLMEAIKDISREARKDNANTPPSFPSKLLQVAEAAISSYTTKRILPEDIAELHNNGAIHIHDIFGYGLAWNCLSLPLKRLLLEGFETGNGRIRPPKRPSSILALAAIIMQANQNEMVGGQMYAHFDYDIANVIRENCKREPTRGEIFQAIEGFIYNLNSMSSRYGSQRVFSNIVLGTDTSSLGRLIAADVFKVMQDGMDGFTFIWPNVIYKIKEGINDKKGTPNFDLTQMALKTAAHRLNPTFLFMDATYNKKYGEEIQTMGCRTRVIASVTGKEVIDGRGNISFTTINLPRIALEAKSNLKKFFSILQQRLELVERQLLHRLEMTGKLKKQDFPFLLGQNLYMDSEKLKDDDEIYSCLIHGTQTFGFCGLEEAVKMLTNYFMWENEDAHKLGLKIIEYMKKYSDYCIKKHGLNFSLLASPAESTAGKFCNCDKNIYGEIENITDKEFYTNSHHISVDADISLFKKIDLEAPFHKLCNGGHIAHLFLDAAPLDNAEAVSQLLNHGRERDMGYMAVNYPINECKVCKFSDPITHDECPKCGSTNINRIRRITGYISSTDTWNSAKLKELERRVDK